MTKYIYIPHSTSLYEIAVDSYLQIRFVNLYDGNHTVPKEITVDQMPEKAWEKFVKELGKQNVNHCTK